MPIYFIVKGCFTATFLSLISFFLYNHSPEKWLQEYDASPSDPHYRTARRLRSFPHLLIHILFLSLFFFIAVGNGRSPVVFYHLLLYTPSLTLLFWSDLLNRVIPSQYLLLLFISGLSDGILSVFFDKKNSLPWGRFPDQILGLILCGGLFFLLFLILIRFKKDGELGFGDVKLLAVIGFCCGASGLLPVLGMSFFCAGIGSLYLLYQNKKKQPPEKPVHFAEDPAFIPLAPFLCIFLFLYQFFRESFFYFIL